MPQRDMAIEELNKYTNFIKDNEGNTVGILNPWLDEDIQQTADNEDLANKNLTKKQLSDILIIIERQFHDETGINRSVIKTTVKEYLNGDVAA